MESSNVIEAAQVNVLEESGRISRAGLLFDLQIVKWGEESLAV